MAKLGSFQEQAGSSWPDKPNQRPETGTVLPGGSTSFHAAKGHPSRFRLSSPEGSLGGSAGPDPAPCPVAADLAVADDLGQAQAL